MTKGLPIAVIGSGAVGVNSAIILAKKGFEVTLISPDQDILQGATQTAFIIHSDGFEYLKEGHQQTGFHCIDGGVSMNLLFPQNIFRTSVCTPENPIRFLLSEASVSSGISLETFQKNAELMRAHYGKHFERISKERGSEFSPEELLGHPDNFTRILKPQEFSDLAGIAGGNYGAGGGANMPVYYAFMKAALLKERVNFVPNAEIESIRKSGAGIIIKTNKGGTIEASQVVIAAGHNTPAISEKVVDAKKSVEGTYYLNAMAYLKLPPLAKVSQREREVLLQKLNHINFTLQAENGCMFACIAPPTETKEGMAAVYFPDPKGNQIASHKFLGADREPPPEWFDKAVKFGLPDEFDLSSAAGTYKDRIMQQAFGLYPFLQGYAEFKEMRYRTVFNADTEKLGGLDRRVRQIPEIYPITEDGKIITIHSPKWTNAHLVALQAVQHILGVAGEKLLPVSKEHGFGPASLNVFEISKTLDFKDVRPQEQHAYNYCTKLGLPVRMIKNEYTSPHFSNIPEKTGISARLA